ncbi:Phenylacetaldehyde reductase [Linum perenne]
MSSGEGTRVCVTGGSGFLGSWLVKSLLQHGYTVNATVRDPYDPSKTKHLLDLDGAKERLQLFKAELMEERSFDSAIKGCHRVFHTASPVIFTPSEPQAQVIDPAVKGTLNVLSSCVRTASVKRVIITSSFDSVAYSRNPLTSSHTDCLNVQMWYIVSKIMAEDVAWEFAKVNEIEVVTIHQPYVISPQLNPTLNDSVHMVATFMWMEDPVRSPGEYFASVDVRDVAEVHIKALEVESAKGRYVLANSMITYPQLLDIVNKLYTSLNLSAQFYFFFFSQHPSIHLITSSVLCR